MALEKAKIVIKEGPDKDKEIPVMFNPSEYKISKSVNYNTQDVKKTDDKPIVYKNGNPANLDVELFFDCDMKYNSKEEKISEQNVKKYTDRILKLLVPLSATDSTPGVPPTCQFAWGDFIFVGYISSATQTFTRFNQKGIPIRATVNLTIMEKPEDTSNNITDATLAKYGDINTSTSDELCNAAKTPEEWRKIAEQKGILNPRLKDDSSSRPKVQTKK